MTFGGKQMGGPVSRGRVTPVHRSRLLFGLLGLGLLTALFWHRPHPVVDPAVAKPENPTVVALPKTTTRADLTRIRFPVREPAPLSPSQLADLPPDMRRVMERGELRIAILGSENPPFFSLTPDGRLQGIDIDIARNLAEGLGVAAVFDRSARTFDEVVQLVATRQADIALSKLSISMHRAKRVRFSRPYLQMRRGLLVHRLQLAQLTGSGNPIDTIKNFPGKLGAIQSTQYAAIFAKKMFPKAEVVTFPDWAATLAALKKGEILAAFRDELEVKKVLLQEPEASLIVQSVAFTDTQDLLAAVLHWEDTHLLATVNQFLDYDQIRFSVDDIIRAYPQAFARVKQEQTS
ncbi:MAG: substrate-binding periplasmic protein [Pseudanabaenaceae cyanobacterium]